MHKGGQAERKRKEERGDGTVKERKENELGGKSDSGAPELTEVLRIPKQPRLPPSAIQ